MITYVKDGVNRVVNQFQLVIFAAEDERWDLVLATLLTIELMVEQMIRAMQPN